MKELEDVDRSLVHELKAEFAGSQISSQAVPEVVVSTEQPAPIRKGWATPVAELGGVYASSNPPVLGVVVSQNYPNLDEVVQLADDITDAAATYAFPPTVVVWKTNGAGEVLRERLIDQQQLECVVVSTSPRDGREAIDLATEMALGCDRVIVLHSSGQTSIFAEHVARGLWSNVAIRGYAKTPHAAPARKPKPREALAA